MDQTQISAQMLVLAWQFGFVDTLTFLQTVINGGAQYFSLVGAELFSDTSQGLKPVKAIFFPLDGFKTAAQYIASAPNSNVAKIRAIQVASYLGGSASTITRPSAEPSSGYGVILYDFIKGMKKCLNNETSKSSFTHFSAKLTNNEIKAIIIINTSVIILIFLVPLIVKNRKYITKSIIDRLKKLKKKQVLVQFIPLSEMG